MLSSCNYCTSERRRRPLKSVVWIVLTVATNCLNVGAAFAPSSLRQSKLQPSFTKALPSVERSSSLPADFSVSQVDVLYEERIVLTYDDTLERYVPIVKKKVRNSDGLTNVVISKRARLKNSPPARLIRSMQSRLLSSLKVALVPEGVTDAYYTYIKWRLIQRFINANVHVLGTQSLLLGLGLKNKGLGVSAALNWVLKDTFGKMVRLLWASKMGRKFDSDAKRWRFRSSLLYALGSAFEIITYMFPSLFLLLATSANALKQISMLTSSSTRTSLYNSFRTRENIGDIVAKGEAQISVVDLLGILSGVCLSRIIRMNIKGVVAVYVTMQVVEIFCIYKMIASVEYKVLNFERLIQLMQNFVASQTTGRPVAIPTPQEMARTEMIFLPPHHLARRAIAFGSLGRAKLAPDELANLLEIFKNERFMLVVGADEKNRSRHRWRTPKSDLVILQENCHIVLHADANNVDIVKSTLALSLLRQCMAQKDPKYPWRSRDCMPDIQRACQDADQWFPSLLRSMSVQGWAPPARFMFGRVTMRAEWPLQPRAKMTFQTSSIDTEVTVDSTNITSPQ